ncbi:MAG TPA: hypothetical protein VNX67_03250 [Solirubrobacteraceae bacterium]|jgi:hypothetical protein|nr:hypothetical protein [Solirubrobacteraceae bacterium]
MNGAAASTSDLPPSQALRLVSEAQDANTQAQQVVQRQTTPERPSVGGEPVRVLVVGAERHARSRMLGELRNLLPAGTHFVEVSETWEVLTSAATSQMAVLVDDLDELSSKSLVRLLARRQPALPVLRVGAGAPAHLDTASM